ncbi:hypothetical protein [Methylopila sp. M107]|uniref:hypothetical protein n=1 Tax=Methylopila sp. M107 TaxID=1101190 RepID=UPI0003A67F14|nr:hypothetical protein [Methylopila sp. M107]
MRAVVAGLVLGLLAAPAMAGEFVSNYDVSGTGPGGGGAYKGQVTVKKTGEGVYQVVWVIGKDKFIGTGIGSPDGLAVGYKSGQSTGIAIYHTTETGAVEGVWTYAGGTQIGTENWSPR